MRVCLRAESVNYFRSHQGEIEVGWGLDLDGNNHLVPGPAIIGTPTHVIVPIHTFGVCHTHPEENLAPPSLTDLMCLLKRWPSNNRIGCVVDATGLWIYLLTPLLRKTLRMLEPDVASRLTYTQNEVRYDVSETTHNLIEQLEITAGGNYVALTQYSSLIDQIRSHYGLIPSEYEPITIETYCERMRHCYGTDIGFVIRYYPHPVTDHWITLPEDY